MGLSTSEINQKLEYYKKTFKEEQDFMKRMEIKQEEYEFKRKHNLIKPPDSPYDCVGCSA